MNKVNNKYLSAGDNAIIVYDKNKYYTSLVHNITEDNGIIIYTPQEEDINKCLLECEFFEIYFNREDAQYKFAAIVKRQLQEGHLELTEIMPVSKVIRIQRRAYCRLKITLPVKIRECNDADKEENTWKSAYLVDMSATGIKISTKDKLDIASEVEVKMYLDDEGYNLNVKY